MMQLLLTKNTNIKLVEFSFRPCRNKDSPIAQAVFHPNRPSKGQISGFGLPLTAVTKNQIKKTVFILQLFATHNELPSHQFSYCSFIFQITLTLDASNYHLMRRIFLH